MRRGIFILILALLLAGTAFCGYRWLAGREERADGEMEWLRREFNLSDEQFARVAALHEAYRPKCDALCAAVVEAHTKLDATIDESRKVTPAVAAALKDVARVEEDCHLAMLAHLYAVSAEMSPPSARRYLAMMKPRIIQSPETFYGSVTDAGH